MKLIILAFILSISLHILFFSSYKDLKNKLNSNPSTFKVDKSFKSKIRYVKLSPKVKQIQKIEKKIEEPIQKPIEKKAVPKIKTYKKVEKKKIVPQKKKKVVKKAKKTVPKPTKKVKIKPILTKPIPKKNIIKPQEKRKTVQKKSLENFLLTDPVPLDRKMLDKITRDYLKLYGNEYDSFTKVQKVFIQSNIQSIVDITRSYYHFPSIAKRIGRNGYNEIKFTLYPNGDISGLEVTKNSKYSYYDKSIIEAIEIAYKDYPRPKTPTTIRFYITYIVR